MKFKKLVAIVAVALAVGLFGYKAVHRVEDDHGAHSEISDRHDEHGSHDEHEGHEEHGDNDEHNGHDEHGDNDKDAGHEEHAGYDEHEDEGQAIALSAAEIQEIGLELTSARGGKIDIYTSLPGEITFNANKLAHIVPTVPGIVRQVDKDLGDTVVVGEIIGWIESTAVGGRKLDYLAKQSEVSCCSIDLVRVQEIYDNTLKLLETLQETPSLETLQKMHDSAMGMNRSRLVSSYAEFLFARETYLREKDLYEKKISSKEDFLAAQRAFKEADATYAATRDSIDFEVKRDLLEARRTQQLREIELQAAERLLYLHGLTAKDVEDLSSLAKNQNSQAKEEDCDDPNCTECAAESATKGQDNAASDLWVTNEKLAWYPIRSPFAGTIIEKHIVLGELVGTESAVYIVADLSSVWVDLQVYPKDLKYIKKGQEVVISADSEIPDARGVISYVGPIVGVESRMALARVELANDSGVFRPGLFITAKTAVSKTLAKVIVSKNAIQSLEGRKCVFVKDDHGFEPAFVEIGFENTSHVEILSGLTAGQEYVTKGAFALKAKIVTSTLDSHAGHGH